MQNRSFASQVSVFPWMCHFPLVVAALVLLPLSLQAQTPVDSTFIAGRGDWFDGINWSGGTTPSENTAARIDGADVQVNGRRRPGVVIVASLSLTNNAEVEVREARLQMDALSVSNSRLRTMSSHLLVLDLGIVQTTACINNCGTIKFNPSLIEAQRANFGEKVVVSFGLGGTNPASANALGRGNYARVVTSDVTLASQLEVEFLYGFAPQAGQQFKIIDVISTGPGSPGRTGMFSNAAEGALVARYNNLGLYISYAGGDGNDVVLTVQALPAGVAPLVYAKQDGDWFTPATWSDGGVPTATKEHILLARQVGLTSSATGPTAAAKSLTLREESQLEVRSARLELETLTSSDSRIRIFSSHLLVLDLAILPGTACFNGCGIKFNPSFVETRSALLGENTTTIFGLAGTNPAAAGSLGTGNYAHLETDTADLRGNLELQFLDGFAPQDGQQFQIITVNTVRGRVGTFANAPEGALVARYNNLGLYITYMGGDGDDVVLTARPLPAGAAPLVYATQDGNWFDPAIWSDNAVPAATKEHILLARQVGLTPPTPGQLVTVKVLAVIDGSRLEVRDARLAADSIDVFGASLNLINSHVTVGVFRDPWGSDGFGGSTRLNPSLLEAEVFEMAGEGTTLTMGLAGTTPAAAGALGDGHYARVVAETANLDGDLFVEFLHGFAPQVGQQFEIIRVNSPNGAASGLIGRFANVREGGVVAEAGNVRLVLSYAGGDGNDVVLTAVPAPPAQSLNVATRVRVETGDNLMIGGFIISGPDAKKVLIRALGPSLQAFGVNNALADPVLDLRGAAGELIRTNDNWRDVQEPEITATTVPPTNDKEAAILATLAPGQYTALLTGKTGTTGVGLIEVYDLDSGAASQLANISTRGLVLTDTNVLIGGFILGGSNVGTPVVVRALGPSVGDAGVANPLADPTLDLRDSNGSPLLFNDNWTDNSQQAAQLVQVGLAPKASTEAAVYVTLPPGMYTAIVAGKAGGTGVGLVEVYNLQ